MKTRHRYLARGFGNEFTIYQVDPNSEPQMREAQKMLDGPDDGQYDAHWVTARDAHSMLARSRARAREYGGPQRYAGMRSIAEALW